MNRKTILVPEDATYIMDVNATLYAGSLSLHRFEINIIQATNAAMNHPATHSEWQNWLINSALGARSWPNE